MSEQKGVIKHGLAGGGFVTLLLAGFFVVGLGIPTSTSMVGIVLWLVLVGTMMLVAGLRERVILGPATLEWPQVAAIAIAVLTLGWVTISLAGVLTGQTMTGLGSLEAVLTLGMAAYFGWFARECWVGGDWIDDATFTVE